jgi:hypothetical protein
MYSQVWVIDTGRRAASAMAGCPSPDQPSSRGDLDVTGSPMVSRQSMTSMPNLGLRVRVLGSQGAFGID